jgi:hypothetical protein
MADQLEIQNRPETVSSHPQIEEIFYDQAAIRSAGVI